MNKLGMLGVEQTADQRNDFDGHSATPRRVSTPGGSPSPVIEGTDSAAELRWREAIPPLRGDRDENLAVQDTQHEVGRAGARLLETLDNTTALPPTLWQQSGIEFITTLIQNAVADGDVVDHHDPEDIAKMLVALCVAIGRISDLDQPEHHLDNLQKAWIPALPGFTDPDRIDYFKECETFLCPPHYASAYTRSLSRHGGCADRIGSSGDAESPG